MRAQNALQIPSHLPFRVLFRFLSRQNYVHAWSIGFLGIILCTSAGIVQAQTPGTATIGINGATQDTDSGQVHIVVNGGDCTVLYNPGDVDATLAQTLVNSINNFNCSPLVTAAVGGSAIGPGGVPYAVTVHLTAKTSGANTNYSLSTSVVSNFPGQFPTSFSVVPFSSTLTGGTDAPPPPSGFIAPKYVVLAVTYAPPGSQSNVNYSNSTMMGTASATSDSFNMNTTLSVTVGGGIFTTDNLFGIGPDGKITATVSSSFAEEQDSNSSVTVNTTLTRGTTIRGPLSDAAGLDHDADIIWLWLNPVMAFSAPAPQNLNWLGFLFDIRDPVGEMDVFGVQVQYLNGHATIPQDIRAVLDRTWAPPLDDGSSPALNAADFAQILKADPFADPSYVVNVPAGNNCTADARFCRTSNPNLQYSPPPPGFAPTTQTFSAVFEKTTTDGQGGQDTRSVGFSTDIQASGGFLADFNLDIKTSHTLQWQNKWSSTTTNKAGQTASLSITGPAAAANYTGPTEFDVFQDTVYGTFMFAPVSEAPDFSIVASPASQTVTAGGSTTFTVSTVALRGFTGNIDLSVTGLPTGASATFSPTPIAGTGSSTMTITTSTGTPGGSYTLLIKGANGTLFHTVTVAFLVADFSVQITPSSQTINAPGSTTYTVSTTAINGFNGVVTLGIGGLPASASATFNPTTITGTGSSTLTVTVPAGTTAGNYQLNVSGSSGSLSHTTAANLTVIAPDFTVSASPTSISVLPGGCASYSISTTALNGFTGAISLSQSGAPSGASAIFNPLTITGAGSSILTVCTSSATPAGSYTLTITGISGTVNHSTLVILTVQDFSLSATPSSQTVTPGTGTSYTVSTTALNGFTGVTSLSISGFPSGASAVFNPTSITGTGSSTLTVTTSSTTPGGTYPLTITGMSGTVSHTVNVTLVVAQPDFTITVTPASLNVTRGSNGSYTVTIGALSGFNGTVNLTVTGLPSRTTATFTPTSITGSGTSTLKITAQSNATRGTSTLTIQGVSGTLTHRQTVTLIIQ